MMTLEVTSKKIVSGKKRLESSKEGKQCEEPVIKRPKQVHVNAEKKVEQEGKAKVRVEDKPKRIKIEKKVERKKQKNTYELSVEAKRLCDLLRRGDCAKPRQKELCQELHKIIKGQLSKLIYAHDTSRVIEWLMVVGSNQIKNELYLELKGEICLLMKSKYSAFFVKKLLKFGTKEQRASVMESMCGQVVKLIRHNIASSVVECAYNEFANASQRFCMHGEFYGPLFAIFKTGDARTLKQILEMEPSHKDGILGHMKKTLALVADKAVIRHSIVHHALLEYLSECSEKDRKEMIETLRDCVIEILHTKEGARVAMMCIWHGTAKDRKIICKSMKTHVAKICMEENGHMVLFSIFDSVDDTVMISKVIIEEILKSALELVFHRYGRKVLLYLVAPRCPMHFHPSIINTINKGDGNSTSKKTASLKYKELLTSVSPKLLQLVSDNMETILLNSSAIIVCQAVLTSCLGDKLPGFKAIAEFPGLSQPLEMADKENPHFIEHPEVAYLFKHLLKKDTEMFKGGSTEGDTSILFSKVLLNTVPVQSLQSWINSNRSAHILALLLETEIPYVIKKVKEVLKPVKKHLAKKPYKGAEVLLSKLNG